MKGKPDQNEFDCGLTEFLRLLYPQFDVDSLTSDVKAVFDGLSPTESEVEYWSEKDSVLITYGNSITEPNEAPLKTLKSFLDRDIGKAINGVHVLPFFPYSSDDGFSIIDYLEVNPELGDWQNIAEISKRYRLMADLVLNHISSESTWFKNFLDGKSPGEGFFIEADPSNDYSQVVRPRTSPLLAEVETQRGPSHVWCTFSHDQVDLNFADPRVLIEILKVIRHYLDAGISILRLDAIAYLWKKPEHSCIHAEETHAVVRLIRLLLDQFAPGTLLITETNVPNQENLSYFGNCNEAHVVYNFSLAPLLAHALLTGTSRHLKTWMMSMPPAPPSCTYLNFTASHDGIGMRPAEGLLSDEEQHELVTTIESFGGKISRRSLPGGEEKAYELNISLFDAMQGTSAGPDEYQAERFICSQTIMMSLEGIPAFYIHSLLATPNDYEGLQDTKRYRSINRKSWDLAELEEHLKDATSPQGKIYRELIRRIQIRSAQPAFHPHATQFTLQLRECFFGFWRQSRDRQQSIFCVSNLTNEEQILEVTELNLIKNQVWRDLLRESVVESYQRAWAVKPYRTLWITNSAKAV
ncbi:MAG: sugar phosphorylase [Planctomycetota bacterium]|nr:sugar phosphorylase [Planctomycetota bacterium]